MQVKEAFFFAILAYCRATQCFEVKIDNLLSELKIYESGTPLEEGWGKCFKIAQNCFYKVRMENEQILTAEAKR